MFIKKFQFPLLCLIVGGFIVALYASDPVWRAKAGILRDSVLIAWVVSLINMGLPGHGLGQVLGIRPRRAAGLLGIVFSPLLHRDITHLSANTVPFIALGWLVLLQEGFQRDADFYAVNLVILLIGGLGTWLLGRRAIHIGASGLVFGYIGFLLVTGYAGGTLIAVGVAAVVFVLYGRQLWGMLPGVSGKRVSWEGHLFGFAGGVMAGLRPDLLTSLSAALTQLAQSWSQ